MTRIYFTVPMNELQVAPSTLSEWNQLSRLLLVLSFQLIIAILLIMLLVRRRRRRFEIRSLERRLTIEEAQQSLPDSSL